MSAEGAARPGDTHTVTETFVVPVFEFTIQCFFYLFTVQYPRGWFVCASGTLDVYELPVEFIIDLRQRHSRIVNACGVR